MLPWILAMLTVLTRWYGITRHGLVLDELWTIEVATGRGSAHQQLPLNQIVPAPALFDLATAPPWINVWTHLQVTHPPLYWIFLRWWENAWGDSDLACRLFSVFASACAVIVLFDTARLQLGVPVAFWAAALFAVASPQVEYGQLTRNYALLIFFSLCMANGIARCARDRVNLTRWCCLVLSILATLLTHYFCIGTVLGAMIYCAIRFRQTERVKILSGFCTAGLIYLVCWGPFFWQQRSLFSLHDEATDFLTHDLPNHPLQTLYRVLQVPITLLFEPRQSMFWPGAVLAIIYVLPFFIAKRKPALLLWGLWLGGTVGVVAAMDFARQTTHLFYIRYYLLAGPAVYVLIPAIFASQPRHPRLVHLVSAILALACVLALPDHLSTWIAEPTEFTAGLRNDVGPDDLIILCGSPGNLFAPTNQYLLVDRCLGPLHCSVLLLDRPPDTATAAQIALKKHVIVLLDDVQSTAMLPNMKPIEGHRFPGRGTWLRMR